MTALTPTTTARCPSCTAEKATPDAQYCTVCGYPLVQPCPYLCGEEGVSLREGEEPRLRCPRCTRPYHVCKNCGRLYTTAATRCETRKCDGRPVASPQIAWGGHGASSARTFTVPSPVRLVTNRASRSSPGVEAPKGEVMGAVLYAGGWIVGSQGDRGWRVGLDGKAGTPLDLGQKIPPDNWRVVAGHDRMFCVHANGVVVVDLPTWEKQRPFDGVFRDQVFTGQRWLGIRLEEEATVLEERDVDGQSTQEPVRLPNIGYRVLAADDDVAWVGFGDGRVYRVEAGMAREVYSAPDYGVEHIALTSSGPVILERSQGGCRVTILPPDGATTHQAALKGAPLKVRNALPMLAVVGGLIVAAGETESTLDIVDLDSGVVKKSRQIPGVSGVVAIAGIADPSGPKLLVAAVMGRNRPIYLLDLLDEGGGATEITKFMQGYDLDLVVADGKIIVAASSRLENLIQIHDASA